MFKKIACFITVIITAALLLGGCGSVVSTKLENAPKTFSNKTQLKNVIDGFNNNTYQSSQKGEMFDTAENAAMDDAAGSSNDYSRTNTQVEGIDEGDTVKVDGGYIYKLQTSGLIIVSASDGAMAKVAEINIENYVPQELYIKDNKLILIGGVYEQLSYSGRTTIEPLCDCMYFSYSKTDIRIYDIADRTAPILQRQITLSGNYYTSRLIGDKFYHITNYHFYYNDESKYIPKIKDSTVDGGAEKEIPLENIYYYDSIPSYSYMILGSISLASPQTESDLKAYLGLGGEIYVSENYIYTAMADYSGYYTKSLFGVWGINNDSFIKTRIIKFALSDLKQKAITRVDGTIKDRYSLDEYNGNLRVATTVRIYKAWENDTPVTISEGSSVSPVTSSGRTINYNIYNNIFVLSENLEIIGKCEKIAYGETVYAARFKKETGTLVTFEQIDPYFIMDLSDPANPRVSAGLKEEGVSQYIHYLGDTNFTIGVGRDTKSFETQWGNSVTWSGIKVSLYDNNGTEAVNKATYTLGSEGDYTYAYSEIFYNPKALLYDYGLGLFAFPVQIWNYGYTNNYYSYSSMTQGLAVFKFDLSAETPLVYRGIISNIGSNVDLNNWENYYNSYWSFITRGMYIGNYIYTVSERYITSYAMDTLEKKSTLETVKDSYIFNMY